MLTRVWRFNKPLGFLLTLVLALVMSMMVNDTPVLVLLLPILVTLATRGGMPASKTLIPVNSAVLIGGMSTTIGTSTNLLVVSIASDMGLPPMSVFHFTPLVLIAAAVSLPFIWLVMPRLLPDNSQEAGHAPMQFLAELRLAVGSSAIGRTPRAALRGFGDDVVLFGDRDRILAVDDRIRLLAAHETLDERDARARRDDRPGGTARASPGRGAGERRGSGGRRACDREGFRARRKAYRHLGHRRGT